MRKEKKTLFDTLHQVLITEQSFEKVCSRFHEEHDSPLTCSFFSFTPLTLGFGAYGFSPL